MLKAFQKKPGHYAVASPLVKMLGLLQENVGNQQIVSPAVAKSAISMEGLQDDQRIALNNAGSELSTALESIADQLGFDPKLVTEAQKDAAAIAGLMAGDFKTFLAKPRDFNAVSTENMSVIQASGLADAVSNRSFALEAYDERENRNAVIYSIAYNYQAARQDEFGEAFFPTLTLTPDNVGFGITVNLMLVYDAIERKITGDFTDYQKKNIIRAVADATVLKKEQTKVTPVHRAQSAPKFAVGIPAVDVVIEGETIKTAPLAMGAKVDLLAISQTETLLATGIMDMTDSLDPAITVASVYMDAGADMVRLPIGDLPLANFVYSGQGNYRLQVLNFATTSVLLNKNSKNLDGTDLGDLSIIKTKDLIVRLEVNVTGNVNTETGELNVFGNMVRVHSVKNAAGDTLSLDSGDGKAVADAVAAAKLVGYDVTAYRTNVNRRQRGQLIDTTRFTQLYNVPLRSPITAIHPTTTDGQTDASDVQALITATRIRVSNESVTKLLEAAQTLSRYVDSRDSTGVGPDVLGVGRFFVRPAFQSKKIDMNDVVDSIKSHERAEDIQAALVNFLRDMAYTLYRDSEYKAAADALAGGMAPVPTVVIGTDPVIARYLTVTGDLRTLANEFNVRIVSTLDTRVAGKIFMTFSKFDESRNVSPDPLNFGNMVWAPELVLTANISRGNTLSRETVVQPRYTYVVHCPVMGVLEVKNIPDVLNKLPIKFDNV